MTTDITERFKAAYLEVLKAARIKISDGSASAATKRDYGWIGTASNELLEQTVDKMLRAIRYDKCKSDWVGNNPMLARAARQVNLPTSPMLRAALQEQGDAG